MTLANGQENSWLEARVEDFVNRFHVKKFQVGRPQSWLAQCQQVWYVAHVLRDPLDLVGLT